ncbi:MAG: IS21 family transposase [Terriglobales bacterium]
MNETLINKIVTLFHGGASVRRIARSLGVSRSTVDKALTQIKQARSDGATPRPKSTRGSLLDAYEPMIVDLLARYPDISAQRVYEELRPRGYTGGYTILTQRVRQLRLQPLIVPVRRFETAPGEQAQMDYSTYDLDFSAEGRRRVYAFSYVLGYSRRQYLRFVESQDFATTIREHIRAFEHLGGVAATCLYDNMKVVVSGYDGDEPVYNPRFLGFAAHYGFRPVACRVRRPQTKGKVERPFGYVESSLLGGRSFHSLEHLNETTTWWLAEVADVREHRQIKARPIDRHAAERPHLLPLPAQPFEASVVVNRIVDAEGFVVYRQNFYSTPWRLIGRNVAVRETEKELVIYDAAFIEAARHPLFPRTTKGQRRHCKEHQPPRATQQRREQLAARFAEFGAAGTQFWEGLVAGNRFGMNQAERVLTLAAAYPRSDVLAALERAVQFRAFSLTAIQRILAVRGRPKTPLDALAEDHRSYLDRLVDGEPTPPRPTSDYQALLGEDPADAESINPGTAGESPSEEPKNPDSGDTQPPS